MDSTLIGSHHLAASEGLNGCDEVSALVHWQCSGEGATWQGSSVDRGAGWETFTMKMHGQRVGIMLSMRQQLLEYRQHATQEGTGP